MKKSEVHTIYIHNFQSFREKYKRNSKKGELLCQRIIPMQTTKTNHPAILKTQKTADRIAETLPRIEARTNLRTRVRMSMTSTNF